MAKTFPFPPSEVEAKIYYAGLPSSPLLVARTGTLWKEPTGPEAYSQLRELRPVGNHAALKELWEDNLALKLHALLDSMEVQWTSTDVVRIANVGEPSAPVILWIGVMPASLSGKDGVVVASKCRALLVEYNITNVDVEIRESIVTRSAGPGPKLLTPIDLYFDKPIVEVHEPLTTALGLPICAQSTPWAEGTGGFFVGEGENTERLLLVTTRHVVFTPNKNENTHFEYRNDNTHPRHNVTLFGDAALNKYLESIQEDIGSNAFTVQYQEEYIKEIEGEHDPETNREHQYVQAELDKAKEAIEMLNPFYQDVLTHWVTPESRVLGHVILRLSPPIRVSEGYSEDWAIIEVDTSKVDASNFNGNAIDLGMRIPFYEFIRMVCPNRSRNARSFSYPIDRLLKLKGTIPDEEMRRPTGVDQNDRPCLMVIKRGNGTGLTVGRANDIFSYTRNYYEDDKVETSKEWAILPRDSKSRAFSAKGDSGSVIVDGAGRIGGLLTSGAGSTPSSDPDVTYATPISFLLKRMQDDGISKPNINPVLTA